MTLSTHMHYAHGYKTLARSLANFAQGRVYGLSKVKDRGKIVTLTFKNHNQVLGQKKKKKVWGIFL